MAFVEHRTRTGWAVTFKLQAKSRYLSLTRMLGKGVFGPEKKFITWWSVTYNRPKVQKSMYVFF